ncbi:glycosyltransferase family 4 protein [Corticimicrobacter populi]|uniref:Glycosyltransferase family 1 protein n=1 Tax=Corticimicrobacter populi TaxID=2175229 RepID=A0A2V1K2H3_9BURK|nr:glycosyltransferase family 4 protein [Corticimicrobacter populi]PWF23111.1 glycosyltransferase family 1 protein [Corticimicrobacter populi]
MRILQINTEKSWRGGERQTLLSMREFRRNGHQVELLARQSGPLSTQAQAENFVCHEVSRTSGVATFLARQGHRYDIVHCQTAGALTWAALMKSLYRRPLVITRRTDLPIRRREAITAFKWRCADRMVAISQAAAREPLRLGLHPQIIPSAVEPAKSADPVRLAQFRDQYLPAGRKVIATAASLTTEKDPETLLRAIAILHRQRQDFIFVHMGTSGPLAERILRLRDELGLETCYVHAGFQPEVDTLYPLFDLFVMSSRHEGLGSSVLDAFMQHVPVVSTDAGGLAESLADERGLLCPVGSPEALAQAMSQALDQPDLCRSMAERAYAYVNHVHGVTAMGQRYLALYTDLLESRA